MLAHKNTAFKLLKEYDNKRNDTYLSHRIYKVIYKTVVSYSIQ
jgi:hypothetical protein